MGLKINELDRLLALLRRKGIPIRAVTIGRMDVFVAFPTIRKLCEVHNMPLTQVDNLDHVPHRIFLDQVLRWIGVSVVDSVDYSDFEGATIVHDMSKPMSKAVGTYDLVYESGTLEHIFNFPVALENVLSLCAVGGQVMLNTPCNNQSGHGFYQFSPELFFSAFRDSKIFNLDAVEIYEDFDNSPRFRVVDPKIARQRVEIRSILSVNMTVILRRTGVFDGKCILDPDHILQTDYVFAWGKREAIPTPSRPKSGSYSATQRERRAFLLKMDGVLRGLIRWVISTRRRSFYVGSPRTDLQKMEKHDLESLPLE